jgi:hypothetical protein
MIPSGYAEVITLKVLRSPPWLGLTATEYLCHKWARICSVCWNNNPYLPEHMNSPPFCTFLRLWVWVMIFSATSNNLSVMSWRSVLFVEKHGVDEENQRCSCRLTLTRRVFLVEQQQTAILHEHQCSPRLFVGFLWLNTWIVFCRSLIAILSFFFWRLCCLSFFHNVSDYPCGILKLFLWTIYS